MTRHNASDNNLRADTCAILCVACTRHNITGGWTCLSRRPNGVELNFIYQTASSCRKIDEDRSLLRWIRENAAAAAGRRGFSGGRGFSRGAWAKSRRGWEEERGKKEEEEEESWRRGSIRMEMERALCALGGIYGVSRVPIRRHRVVARQNSWTEAVKRSGSKMGFLCPVKTRSFACVVRRKGFARHFSQRSVATLCEI